MSLAKANSDFQTILSPVRLLNVHADSTHKQLNSLFLLFPNCLHRFAESLTRCRKTTHEMQNHKDKFQNSGNLQQKQTLTSEIFPKLSFCTKNLWAPWISRPWQWSWLNSHSNTHKLTSAIQVCDVKENMQRASKMKSACCLVIASHLDQDRSSPGLSNWERNLRSDKSICLKCTRHLCKVTA